MVRFFAEAKQWPQLGQNTSVNVFSPVRRASATFSLYVRCSRTNSKNIIPRAGATNVINAQRKNAGEAKIPIKGTNATRIPRTTNPIQTQPLVFLRSEERREGNQGR